MGVSSCCEDYGFMARKYIRLFQLVDRDIFLGFLNLEKHTWVRKEGRNHLSSQLGLT